MQRALVVMTTALLAAAQTTPSICQSNSDCSSGLVCSNGACSAAGSATADPINCTITTLSQCGSDWSTRLKQPLVIGLIVGGGVLLLICLPTIICCIVKGTICFAFKTTKKVAVGSAKAVAGAAKHTAPDRHRPPTNSQIIANRARIYGGGEESNDQKSEYKSWIPGRGRILQAESRLRINGGRSLHEEITEAPNSFL
ncbi:hypothetical protein BDR26DRAFT_687373 [Obelidium mucronatum]|nr:hypothetical protein BDR26DRAFT_687373 [Obelidium mucronatum]